MGFLGDICSSLKKLILPETFTTVKLVNIDSPALGAIESIIGKVLLIYVICSIYFGGTYQKSHVFDGQVTIKVKGVTSVPNPNGGFIVYDAEDIVQPAIENGALFVTTSLLDTLNQTRTVCLGTDTHGYAPAQRNEVCDMTTNSCPTGIPTLNGVTNGRCAQNSQNVSMCLLDAWCPLENKHGPSSVSYELPGVCDPLPLTPSFHF